jgi:hypothetical protein
MGIYSIRWRIFTENKAIKSRQVKSRQVNIILNYKIHYTFYCVVYSIMIYLLYTNTRLGRLCFLPLFFDVFLLFGCYSLSEKRFYNRMFLKHNITL